ncbi:YadA-like family protein [Neisseria subflava]|uniref:YadA-like family protein n=1 Tax=Neisseria subflava TaxID=28449 RepID=A0A9X9HYM7_NEISU|nr:YadA-like family protein [Neisseria subflava]UTG71965.1 YadA-like family protein [Neisseria subflava]
MNAIERVRYFSVKSEEGKTDGTKNWNNDGAKETNSIAIGPNAATSTGATGSISLGHNANVLGSSSVAVGPNATVTSRTVGAVALGSNANSRGTGSIAIGLNTENDRNYSIVVGAHSRANYENATVVGARASAQNNGTAMGYLSNAVGDDSVAIGHQAQTAQSYSIAIGKQANSSGLYSTAIGSSAQAAGHSSFAGGNNAKATGSDSVALGNGATTTVGSSVALGNGAVGAANNFDATAKNASFKNDSGAATNVSYAASSSSKTGAVSVGSAGNERQIQNVAAGRISATSTDAVNGSQLYAVMNNVGHNIQQNGTDKSRINNNGTVNYANGNLTTVAVTDGENASKVQINVTQGSLSVNNNGTVSAPTAGVATAGDVANAINNAKTTTKVEAGSNTHVNKTTSGKETTYTVSADKATVQVSNALNLTSNTTTASDGAVTTNYSIDLAQSTKTDIQKGVDAKTTVDTKGLTFNGDSGSTNIEKLGSTVTVAGDDNITTEAQDDKVTVKLNKDLAVDSVKAGDTTVNNDGVKIAGGPSLTKSGIDAAGNKVTNVAAGDLNANSKDAVNGSQLFATNQNVANNAANIAKGINFGGTTGSNNYALGDTINVKGDSNIISETVAGGAQLKLAKDITVDSVTAGDSKLNTDGLTITGGPSVTKAGIDAAGNRITNVAPGTDDTDAVNYSQLKQQSAAARTEVAAGTNIKDVVKTTGANGQDVYTVNAKGTTASAGSSKVTVTAAAADANNVTDYSIDLAQDTKDDIQKGVDAKTTVDTKGLTFNGDSGSTNVEKLGSTVTVAGDDNITTEAQDDKVTVKLNKDLAVDSVKAGDTTVNNDGVKIAGGPSLTKSGIDAAGNKVTNVAAGDLNANSKDAVNGSQLFATNQNVANNAANIAKGINFGGTTGSNNYALGDTINVKGDSNIISETVAGGAQLKLAKDITVDSVTAGDSKLNTDGLTITGGPSVTKAGIDAAGNRITNVAPGTDDTDAVNYSQLKQQSAAARTEVAAGTNIKDVVKTTGANGQDVYTVNAKGTTASAGSSKVTVTAAAADANNVTNYSIDLAQDTKDDIQKGVDAKTTVDTKGLTFNGDSGSTNIEKLGATVTVAGDDNITTEAQDDKVTVKLNKDLVVDSVKAGDTTVNNDGVKVGDDVALTQDGVKAGDVKLTKDGLNNAGNKVTNVADGDLNANSKDAVNGSQLFATNQNVANNAANIAKGINFGGTTGSNNYALGDTINVKGDSNIISETVAGGAQLKLAKDITVDSVTAGDSKLNTDGLTITGGPSVTKAGIDAAGNRITNVAPGTDDTDAVNYSQLKQQSAAARTEVAAGTNIKDVVKTTGANGQDVYTVNAKGTTASAGSSKVTVTAAAADANNVTNYSIDLAQDTKDDIQKGVDAKTTVDTKGLTFNGDSGSTNIEKLGSTVTVAGDDNITTEAQDDKVTVKLNKDLAVDSVKAGDTTVNNDGVKIAGGPSLTKSGIDAAGNKVTNVAAGDLNANSKDAVNGSQLFATNQNVANNAANIAKGINFGGTTGSNNYALGDTINVKGDSNIISETVAGGAQLKLAKDITVDSVTAGDSKLNTDGLTITGGPSVTKAGIDAAGNRITNVAPGTDDTDAVNYSQLKQQSAAARTEVAAGTNIKDVVKTTGANGQDVYTVNAKGTTASAGSSKVTVTAAAADANNVTDYSIDLAQDTKDDIQKGVDAKTTVDTKGLTFNGDSGSTNIEKLGSTVTVAGDDNITTEAQDDKVTVKLNKDLAVDSVKAGDTTVNNDGVKIAGGPSLTKSGIDAAGNKVTNVAAGDLNANSKDAVNGSQLFATNQNVANNAANIAKGINFGGTTGSNNYALGDTINVKGDSNIISETVAGGAQLKLAKDITVDSVTAGDSKLNTDGLTITGGPSVTKAGIDAAGNRITNVAPGTDDTDAVNYSQLKQQSAAARTEVAAGTNIKDVVKTTGANGQDVYTVNAKGTTASAGSSKVTVTAAAADANNVTNYSIDLAQDTKDDIQKGVDAKTTVDTKGLTFNGDSGSTNIEKLGSTVTVAGDDNITTEAQDDKVTVKLNKDLAVDSVKAGDTTVNNDGVKIAGGPSLTKSGIDAAGNKVTNVAAGDLNANSKDAVNGSQLFATNQNVANNAANIAKGINFGGTTGSNNYALGDTINVKGDSNIISETVAGGAQLKLAKDITVDSVTAGDSKLNTDGLTITGGPSVTKAGIDAAGNRITNVAPGTDDTDAVNYSQLKQQSAAARTEVAAGTNIKDVVKTTGANGQDVYTVNAKGTTASAGSSKVTVTAAAADANNVTNYSIDLAQDTKDDIQKGVDAKTTVDTKGLTFNGDSGSTNVEKLGSTVTVAGDDNITTEAQDDKVTVKLNKDLAVDSVKAGDTTVNNDGVKIAGGPSLTKSGIDAAGNKVTNVAAGDLNANSKDAVNGSQLFATNQNVANNAANIAKGINFGGTTGSNNYALGDTINVKGDSNIISETVAGGAQLKLAKDITVDSVTAGDSKLNTDGLTITGGPSVTKAGIDAAGNRITNVAPGTDDTDAVNYSQLKQQSAAARTEVAAGTNIKDVVKTTGANGQDVYTVNAKGTTASAGSSKVTVTAAAADANNVTNYSIDLAQDTKDDIQKGVDAKTTVDTKGLTFNGDSGSTNIEKLGATVTVAGDDNITTEAQDDKVTVKLNKDLVVDSVKAGDTTVNNDGVKVGDDVALTQDGVKAGDVKLTKDGLNNAGNKVTNVADGDLNANSKDAVNGSQLFATNQNVANNAANIAKGINFGGTTGSNNYALGDTINVKGDSNIISETVAGGAQLKLAKDITVDSVTAGDSKLNTDGLTITGGPSVTKAGIDAAGNRITNVAPGTDDTDAVNYSQLKQQSAAARTEVAAGTNIKDVVKTTGANGQDVYTVNAKGTTASAGSSKVTVTAAAADANNVTNYSIDLAQDTKDDIQKGVDAKTTVDTKGLTFNGDSGSTNVEKLGATVTVAGDDNITTEAQDDKVTVKLNKDLVVDSVKAGDTTVNNDGVKVAGGPSLTKSGIDAAGNKVTNVADGDLNANSKDAVNGSQLFATNQNVANNAANIAKGINFGGTTGSNNYALGDTINVKGDSNIISETVAGGAQLKLAKDITVDSVTAGDSKLNTDGLTITGGPSVTKAGIDAAGNRITNVAPGTDDTDAVNYSQLKQQSAAARTEVAAGTNIKDVVKTTGANGQDVYTVNAKGTTASAGSSKVTVTAAAADANNVTNYSIDLAQDTKDDIQKGVDAKTTVDTKGLTFNGDSGSTNVEKLGATVTVAGDDNITTEAQDDKVTVKLNKDLVVDSVKAGDTTVNNDGVKVAGGPSLTKSGIDAAGNKVTNVADGDLNANSKDAVNGSQLFATNQNVANNAANIAKGINFGGTTGSNNYALGDTINVKGDSNIISETVAGGAQLKLAKDITVDSVTAGDSKLNTDGLTITGGPSVTKAGIDAAGNRITNVAPGTDDTDAVNYSQLKQQSAAARTEVAAGTNIKDVVKTTGANGQDVYTVNAKGTTASAGSSKVTVTAAAADANNVTNYSIDLAQDTKDDIQKGVDAKTTVDTKGLTFNGDSGSTNVEKLGSTVTVAGDDNITTEAQDDKVTVKLNKDLAVDSVKAGDTTVNNDGVKIAGGPSLTKSGIDAAGNKVTNVAAGDLNANSKDAVNGSQLFATNQNVANNAANIAKGINFGGTTGSNNYALGDTINVKGDSNIISETVAGGAQLKLADVLNVGQAAPVKIDGDKGEVSGLSNTTLGGSDFAQGKRAATEEQLNAAQDQLVNVLGGNAANNGGNISMTDIGGTGENNIHDAIKAVNATANLPLTFGGDSGKDVERKPGTKLNIVGGQTDAAKLSDGNIGVVANGSDKLEVKLAKDLAVDSVKAGDTTVNTDGMKVGDVNLTKAGLNNGGNKITNVAAGTDDTDAVNVAQLNKAAAAAKTEVVQGDNIVVTQDVGANGQTIYKVATDKNLKVDSVTAGDTVMNNDGVKVGDDVALNKDGLKAGDVNLTKAGLNNGGNKITNVAAGTDDTDAVNVSQLKQAAAASKTEVVQGKNIVVTQKTGDKGQTVYEVATDKDLDVDSVKAGDTTVNTDGVKVGDDVALNKDGLKAGKVNLTKDGLDNAGNKVTNVADGDLNANSKDAVNGSQLHATNQNVANNAATIAKGINFGGTTGSNNYALGSTINVKGDSNIISETVAGGAQLKLADEISVKTVNADTFKAGDTVMNNDGVKVGDKVALNKDGLTAGNTVVNNDGVTIAAPTENNPNNQVKLSPVGLNNGGQRITNVAPGKDGTDAANVNQLIGLGTELQNNINQVGKKAYAGVAGAIAQGSIPQVTRPGATGIGVGSGYYGGQSAMAIGVSAMSDGGNWIVKGNFSANTDGHVGVGAGALYQW